MANVNLKDSMFLWHMSIRTNNEANVMKPNSKETFARTELARKVVWQGFVTHQEAGVMMKLLGSD